MIAPSLLALGSITVALRLWPGATVNVGLAFTMPAFHVYSDSSCLMALLDGVIDGQVMLVLSKTDEIAVVGATSIGSLE
jgi:hypothetical protein